MRRSSKNAVNYHAPRTEVFPDASVANATPVMPEPAQPHSAGKPPGPEPMQPPPVSGTDHAIPLQRGPIGVYYQPPPPFASASDKGMNAGEKHALVAGFFVMFSLAAALGIGWWATLPPASTVLSGERPTPQAGSWAKAKNALSEPDSSGSSDVAAYPDAHANEPAHAKKAASVAIPAVNEINLSKPNAKEEAPSEAAASSVSPAKSGRSSGQAGQDTRAEEVKRLKAQAYSETRKDRLGRSTPAKPASKEEGVKPRPVSSPDSVSSAQKPDLRRALAKCQDEKGLFFRERCKWRLCNGQWGKYGCPSYGGNKRDDYSVS